MSDQLLDQAKRGDRDALGRLMDLHRDRLRRMVGLRMDRRLQGRIDASDVIQDALTEASTRFDEYASDPKMPFFLWLRFLTGQRLVTLHRRHFGVQARDPTREVSLSQGALPEATSTALAAQLIGQHTSPSNAVARIEMEIRVQDALSSLDEIDREVLTLRHFEQLSNSETAAELAIPAATASQRYVRALRRLRESLVSLPGGAEFLGGE